MSARGAVHTCTVLLVDFYTRLRRASVSSVSRPAHGHYHPAHHHREENTNNIARFEIRAEKDAGCISSTMPGHDAIACAHDAMCRTAAEAVDKQKLGTAGVIIQVRLGGAGSKAIEGFELPSKQPEGCCIPDAAFYSRGLEFLMHPPSTTHYTTLLKCLLSCALPCLAIA